MEGKIYKIYGLVLSLAMCFWSCTEEIDLNQAEDLELSPVIENSLLFFEAPASEFFEGGTEVNESSDFIEVDIFKNSFNRSHLIKAEFVFEVVNSIDRSYELQIDFLDDLDQLVHTFSFEASASPDNSEIYTKYTEVFEGNTLRALMVTGKLSFTITMQPGDEVNENSPGRINMQSKSVFYFNIKD
ncbi:hypothetical protein FPF71_04670 [Algibacter amylolyticus]|uniref:Uncharacterized protein n=1 Tax=Algibacter amylolyticus TaxID=1608400 RepID=A0A5M7BH08_9FLAO|nr:hypothetical protein [Algibacter amylolyticus]KAA5828133.1 hypothetical protein F2B50_04670 [Algibacter amylolyticus]MBB5267382.1 hypothetical protein [Algibacter amylolyticus]TSJ82378.1 hypothetical protein FPF71_04670 [Algibacter amylolyticus]